MQCYKCLILAKYNLQTSKKIKMSKPLSKKETKMKSVLKKFAVIFTAMFAVAIISCSDSSGGGGTKLQLENCSQLR